ncbi:hypothetical protein ACJW31_01G168800 [Castanea mollissima]
MKIEELDECEDGADDGVSGRQIEIVRSVDAKRAIVGAGARILFYPTLLYNVLRNKIESEFRWWDQVDQFLLLGAVPFPKDVPRLKQLGVGGVITLNEPYETLVPTSLYLAHEIDHLVIPTRDYLFAPSFVDISQAVDFIHQNASSGRTTYVHCKAGRGRSTTIVLCYLVRYKHMTPIDALEYVRSRRPRVLLAPSQWKGKISLVALTMALEYGECCCRLFYVALHCGAVQEYSKRESSTIACSPSGDAVLITKADLEGYHGNYDGDTVSRRLPVAEARAC